MPTSQRINALTRIGAITTAILLAAALGSPSRAADNLRLNAHLDYSSDSQDGPLITGDHMDQGVAAGKPNYVIFYGEGCYNSKHQARRTVSLYEKYKGRVQFVIVDLDRAQSPAQQALMKKYYRGAIPHVTILDSSGNAVYDQAGEASQASLSRILDSALRQ
jgi:thiol:disulfide interchange protein